jgi:acyl-CoA dehydrogenase
MDFSFSEEQDDISGLARRILTDKLPEEKMREVEAGVDRFDSDLWKALADAGMLGIGLPESVGGGGYGILEQSLVLKEVGRTVAPVPVWASTVLGAMPIAEFGTPDQQQAFAAKAASGELILTAALVEPLQRDPLTPTTAAKSDGDGYRLTGTKTCVPAGMLAGAVLVPAAIEGGGIGVFIVDIDAPGLTRTRQEISNKDAEAYLELDGVTVGSDRLLGSVEQGAEILRWIVERGTVGLCAQQLGVCEKALEMTAEYSKTRVQFDRPIATFQAVGQRLADAYIDVEGLRLTWQQAAWRLAEGLPSTTEVETAKFWAAETGHRVAHAAVHVHGGVGIDVDYPLHRYFIAAKWIEFNLGGASDQLHRIGKTLAAEPVS